MMIATAARSTTFTALGSLRRSNLDIAARTMTSSSTASSSIQRPPLPPFTKETAIQKVRMAEDAWNSQDPDRVKMAYTKDSVWRNRSEFVTGRDEIRKLLEGKWQREQDYRLIKEIWSYTDNRIAVRFCYEYSIDNNNEDNKNDKKKWFRAHGNENWEFDENGLMAFRHASINDVAIEEADRKFHWETGSSRPDDHPGLTALGL